MRKATILHLRPKARRDTVVQAPVEHASSAQLADEATRRAMVAHAAYYRAQKRGFVAGRELDDWLAAEAEIVGRSRFPDRKPGAD